MVYEIPCKGCYKTYVGETGRGVDVRLKEHRSDVKFHRTSNAIVLHIEECHHLPDWNETKLLEKNVKKRTRKVLEAAHILGIHLTLGVDSLHGHRRQQNWRWANQTRDFYIQNFRRFLRCFACRLYHSCFYLHSDQGSLKPKALCLIYLFLCILSSFLLFIINLIVQSLLGCILFRSVSRWPCPVRFDYGLDLCL